MKNRSSVQLNSPVKFFLGQSKSFINSTASQTRKKILSNRNSIVTVSNFAKKNKKKSNKIFFSSEQNNNNYQIISNNLFNLCDILPTLIDENYTDSHKITFNSISNQKETEFLSSKVTSILTSYPNFRNFISNNSIPFSSFMNCLQQNKEIFLVNFPEKFRIYNFFEESKFFYIVIKGILSLKEIVFLNGISIQEKMCLMPGMFFGENELIFNKIRQNSVFSKTNCVLLQISLFNFNLHLKPYLLFNEKIKRKKLCCLIPSLKTLNFEKYNQIYKNFIVCNVNKENFIYKKNDDANCLIFINKGKAKLIDENNKNVLFLNDGNICGFESIENINKINSKNFKINSKNFKINSNNFKINRNNNFNNKKYFYSLFAIEDCEIIKIRTNILFSKLNDDLYRKFLFHLEKHFKCFNNVSLNFNDEKKRLKNKVNFSYREKEIKKIIKLKNNITQKDLVEEYDLIKKKEEKKIDKKKFKMPILKKKILNLEKIENKIFNLKNFVINKKSFSLNKNQNLTENFSFNQSFNQNKNKKFSNLLIKKNEINNFFITKVNEKRKKEKIKFPICLTSNIEIIKKQKINKEKIILNFESFDSNLNLNKINYNSGVFNIPLINKINNFNY